MLNQLELACKIPEPMLLLFVTSVVTVAECMMSVRHLPLLLRDALLEHTVLWPSLAAAYRYLSL